MKALLLSLFISLSLFAQNDKPNVIFIFADDIGYEALNCYGGLDFETPNLNKMAKDGILFQKMYTSPVCTPSRVSMHTGTYTFRHKHYGVLPVHNGTKKKVNFQKMPTFAQQIRNNGYMTSVTGKWQLATLEVWPDHIQNAGFDSWCVWQIWRQGKKTERHWGPVYNRDGKVMEGIENKFGPDVLTDYVLQQMETATKAKKPFFILHNELLPHWPLVETPDDRQLGRNKSLKGLINYMDKLIGRILDKTEELGIRDNTYVFFMGDNGTWEPDVVNPKFGEPGEKKHTRHTIHGNVNGGKAMMCDGGAHVPFIGWGPKSIPAGAVNTELVDVVDLFSTFCEVTGTKIPETVKTDGRSIASQIHGQTGPKREWTHQGYKGESIFDGSWRYFIKSGALWDARKLPVERKLTKTEIVERQEIIKTMKKIHKDITRNLPQEPKPLSFYR